MGRNYKKDIHYIKELRNKWGNGISISIDANHAYPVKLAVKVYKALERETIEIVEEPCINTDLESIKRVIDETGIKVMLDESIKTDRDIKAAASLGVMDVLNIKLPRIGGLRRAIAFSNICRDFNIPIYLGHSGEFSLGLLSMIFLYCNIAPPVVGFECVPPIDLYGYDIVPNGIQFKEGQIQMTSGQLNRIRYNEDFLFERLAQKGIPCTINGQASFKYHALERLKSFTYKLMTAFSLIEPLVINRHNPRRGK